MKAEAHKLQMCGQYHQIQLVSMTTDIEAEGREGAT